VLVRDHERDRLSEAQAAVDFGWHSLAIRRSGSPWSRCSLRIYPISMRSTSIQTTAGAAQELHSFEPCASGRGGRLFPDHTHDVRGVRGTCRSTRGWVWDVSHDITPARAQGRRGDERPWPRSSSPRDHEVRVAPLKPALEAAGAARWRGPSDQMVLQRWTIVDLMRACARSLSPMR